MLDLSSSSRERLIQIARSSIAQVLEANPSLPPELKVPAACFITLRKAGKLRGCIGTFDAKIPLYQNISQCARSAAFGDPRFPPVTREELDQIRIEISVLGPFWKMNSITELETGRHGVWVKCGLKSGTFLPEVATDEGWTAEEFIRHCAMEKAGMSAEELSRAEIFLYEVKKIKE